MRLSVIIPTLNERSRLELTLADVAAMGADVEEVIVADGGSTDGTPEFARGRGARVVTAARGRGGQLRAGAAAAAGDILWFLHADTRAPAAAAGRMVAALRDERRVGGNFRLRFEGSSRGARFLNALYPKLRLLGLRYGDSGLFARASAYRAAGGFAPLPIFEDLDFLRRLRRLGRLTTLEGPLVTSARRFEGKPFAPVFAHWAWLQLLYWLGSDPVRLGKRYYLDDDKPPAPAGPAAQEEAS